MQYSPKLKMAMNEIRGILAKHDIAGLIVLHAPGNCEYMLKIDPSYSCAKFDGDNIRIRAKLQEDFNGNKEAWTKKVSETSGMLNSISEVGGNTIISLMEISSFLDKKVGAEHTDLGHTSENTQNN